MVAQGHIGQGFAHAPVPQQDFAHCGMGHIPANRLLDGQHGQIPPVPFQFTQQQWKKTGIRMDHGHFADVVHDATQERILLEEVETKPLGQIDPSQQFHDLAAQSQSGEGLVLSRIHGAVVHRTGENVGRATHRQAVPPEIFHDKAALLDRAESLFHRFAGDQAGDRILAQQDDRPVDVLDLSSETIGQRVGVAEDGRAGHRIEPDYFDPVLQVALRFLGQRQYLPVHLGQRWQVSHHLDVAHDAIVDLLRGKRFFLRDIRELFLFGLGLDVLVDQFLELLPVERAPFYQFYIEFFQALALVFGDIVEVVVNQKDRQFVSPVDREHAHQQDRLTRAPGRDQDQLRVALDETLLELQKEIGSVVFDDVPEPQTRMGLIGCCDSPICTSQINSYVSVRRPAQSVE